MSGYHSRIIFVDLSRGKTVSWSPFQDFYEKYIGGRGLGVKLLLELTSQDTDPLSPENTLIFAAGPLTGTPVPMSSRLHVVFKSPATRALGESGMGGSFPYYFKHAGIDALVIRGRASKPVYVRIEDSRAEIRSARHVWGLDAYEAERILVEENGGKSMARAAVIGPAGENMVYYACITHGSPELGIGRGGQAGRTGGGAVMGSKNLKAVVVVKNREPPLVDKGAVEEYAREITKKMMNTTRWRMLREYGTSAMINTAQEMGFLPSRYWSRLRCSHYEGINSSALRKILKTPLACITCPAACGRRVEARYKNTLVKTEGPEYETLYALGSLAGLTRIEEIAYINDLLDKLGLDTISFGNIYAFAVEAYMKNLLDTPYKLAYGNIEAMAKLAEDIAYVRGKHSEILSRGVGRAAKQIGFNKPVHVKNLEPPGYDPRTLWSMYLAYATSPRGACHLRSMAYMIDIKRLAGTPASMSEEKIKAFIEWEDWCSLFDSLILCKFGRDFYSFEEMARALRIVTGWDIDEKWIREAGKRVTLLAHYYNRGLHGMGWKYDDIPEKLYSPAEDNGRPIDKHVLENSLERYYSLRGFNTDGTMDSRVMESNNISIGELSAIIREL